jgi:multidrug efflux system membrane fusion protein
MSAATTLLRGRRRAAPIALGLGLLAVAGIVGVSVLGGESGPNGRPTSARGATATVARRTLVQRETVDGTLGYAGNRTVINRLSASGGGGGGDGNSSDGASPAASAATTGPSLASAAMFTPAQDTPDPNQGQDQPSQPDSGQDDDNPSGNDDDKPSGKDKDKPSGQDDNQPSAQDDDQSSANDDDQSSANDNQQAPPADSSKSPSSASPSSDGSGSDAAYSGSGTLTALPRAGSVLERGDALYHLDGDPIVLMYGSTPAYRDLKSGMTDGDDVLELEENLSALGFDPGTIDDSFTSATAAAVSDWQESVGLKRTGAVQLGRVVFLPGPRRVGEHKASVGSVLGGSSEVLVTSSTKRVVAVELDASLQDLARQGARVQVTLPDGALVGGHITNVGRVARQVDSGSSDPNAEQQLVIDVTIELRSKRGIGRLDEAPVGVGLAQETRRHVLAVPVNAIVARRGGGYGVELAAGRRIVPVQAGLFADGYVEVSGPAIREGTRVVVPSE